MEDKLVSILHANYGNVVSAPVYIQSFLGAVSGWARRHRQSPSQPG